MKKIIIGLLIGLGFILTAAGQSKTVILPERFKDYKIVVINSSEYKDLLTKNKELAAQLKNEAKQNEDFSKKIEEQAARNTEIQNALIKDNITLKQQISDKNVAIFKKDAAILRRDIIILFLVFLIAAYIVSKLYFKSALPFLP